MTTTRPYRCQPVRPGMSYRGAAAGGVRCAAEASALPGTIQHKANDMAGLARLGADDPGRVPRG